MNIVSGVHISSMRPLPFFHYDASHFQPIVYTQRIHSSAITHLGPEINLACITVADRQRFCITVMLLSDCLPRFEVLETFLCQYLWIPTHKQIYMHGIIYITFLMYHTITYTSLFCDMSITIWYSKIYSHISNKNRIPDRPNI